MNNSKNNFSLSPLFANIKERIEKFFKSCFPKNKIYVDASTQTEDSCYSLCQDSMDSPEILSPQQKPEETIKQEPEANPSTSKFIEDSQFSRILKSYSQLNSSNYLPLNLNNGLLYQPIYAEGESPAELELESFKATLKCYKNILSSQSNSIYKGFQWSSKFDFPPISNSESFFRPIKSEVKFSPTIDKPSNSLNKPNLLTTQIKRTLAL
jgi:hypothetical protein